MTRRGGRLDSALAAVDGGAGKTVRALRMVQTYRNPATALRNRLRRPGRPSPITYRLRSGPALRVDSGPHDVRVINEIWLDRIYELEPALVPRSDWCVVDVGAHKGIFSARVASLIRRGSIHSYEPDPHNFSFLVQNVQSKEGLAFDPKNVAVGAVGRRDYLYLQPNASGRHSLYRERVAGDQGRTPIDVLALRDVIDSVGRPVDLLKLDVEGAEYEIILDSPSMAFDDVRRVVLEVDRRDPRDGRSDAKSIADRLDELGYVVRRIPKRSLLAAWRPTT